uniref:Uncharacterized protein n=1 Tax=Setaria digitata TaxID=48799 RepID=A0A915Q649_9BILA
MTEDRRKLFADKMKKLLQKGKHWTKPNSSDTDSTKNRENLPQKMRVKKIFKQLSAVPKNRLRTAKVNDDAVANYGKYSRRRTKRDCEKIKKPQNIVRARESDKFSLDDKQKETFIKFINGVCDLGVSGLVKQYEEKIKTYKPPDHRCDAFRRNLKRNRYKDVKCLDNTRVVLKQKQDYIHANYVTSKYLLNQFICTQAPMKSTANDFWTMVMQENVRYIIMLCNIVESGKKKCHTYYPTEVGSKIEFDEITVSNTNIDLQDPATIISALKVEKNDNALFVSHVLWCKWPDHGVPSSELAPFEILKMVRRSRKRPTVVHCSAGVGRTGTIIAIEMGLEQLLHCVPLSMVELCRELRDMRAFSIQTNLQYVYIVKCLLAYAWCCGIFINTPELIPKSDIFDQEYKELIDGEGTKPVEGALTAEQIAEGIIKNITAEEFSDKKNFLPHNNASVQKRLDDGSD